MDMRRTTTGERHSLRSLLGVGATLAGLLLALGCGGGQGGSAGGGAGPTDGVGRVTLLLTDKPNSEFDEILVTITGVKLLGQEAQVGVFPVAGGPAAQTVNLLALEHHATLFSDALDVPAGCYDKIRLEVSEVELVERDGEGTLLASHPAKLPANGKIDLNPRQPFCIADGENLVLQLDMDARKSVHVVERGNSDRVEYNFRPVVFVDVLAPEVPGKLVRLAGTVGLVSPDRFVLCAEAPQLIGWGPTVDWNGCVQVELGPAASLFGKSGTPLDPPGEGGLAEVLAEGDFATVLGRFAALSVTEQGGERPETESSGTGTALPLLVADLVTVGTSWRPYVGTVMAGPDSCGGTFEFLLDEGQGVSLNGNTQVPVHLFEGTAVFDSAGGMRQCADLVPGARVRVDAVLFLSTEQLATDLLDAAVVTVDTNAPLQELSGTLRAAAGGGYAIETSAGANQCIELEADARFFTYLQAVPAEQFVELDDLVDQVGLAVRAFGSEPAIEGGCFTAGLVLVESSLTVL